MDINNLLSHQATESYLKSQSFPPFVFPQHEIQTQAQQQVPQSTVEEDHSDSTFAPQQNDVPSFEGPQFNNDGNQIEGSVKKESALEQEQHQRKEAAETKVKESTESTTDASVLHNSSISLPPLASLVPQQQLKHQHQHQQPQPPQHQRRLSKSESWNSLSSTQTVPGSLPTSSTGHSFSSHSLAQYEPSFPQHIQPHNSVIGQQQFPQQQPYLNNTNVSYQQQQQQQQPRQTIQRRVYASATLAGKPAARHTTIAATPPEFRKLVTKVKMNRKPTAGNKKRKQVKKACVNCRRTHMSCDDCRPCRRCVKLGIAEKCKDGESKKRGRPRKKPLPENPETDHTPPKAEDASSPSSSQAVPDAQAENASSLLCYTSQFQVGHSGWTAWENQRNP